MLPVCKALESIRFVKPIFDAIPQGSIYIMSRHYTKELYERARAVENAHFLKIQNEQLKNLRNKIARENRMREHKGNLKRETQQEEDNRNLHKTQNVITQQADS